MDYTAYQEGSFSTTIKTLQAQVTDLHKQNLQFAKQLQQAAASLQGLTSENVALRNKLMSINAAAAAAESKSSDRDSKQLLNEVGELGTSTTESTKKTTSKKTPLNE